MPEAAEFVRRPAWPRHRRRSRSTRRIQFLERLGRSVNIYPDAEEFIQRRLLLERISRRVAEIRVEPESHPLRRELLKTELLPYQLDGIAFAVGAGRAVLADDMGLGKTIQGIGVAELLAREAGIAEGARRLPRVGEIAMAERNPALLRPRLSIDLRQRRRAGRPVRERLLLHGLQLRTGAARHPVDRTREVGPDHSRRRPTDQKLGGEDQPRHQGTSFAVCAWCCRERRSKTGSTNCIRLCSSSTTGGLARRFVSINRHRVVDEKGKVLGYKNLAELRESLRPVLLRRTRQSVRQQLPPRTNEIVRIAPTEEQLDLARLAHANRQRDRAEEVSDRDGPAPAAEAPAHVPHGGRQHVPRRQAGAWIFVETGRTGRLVRTACFPKKTARCFSSRSGPRCST